jgi:hypothetical protein
VVALSPPNAAIRPAPTPPPARAAAIRAAAIITRGLFRARSAVRSGFTAFSSVRGEAALGSAFAFHAVADADLGAALLAAAAGSFQETVDGSAADPLHEAVDGSAADPLHEAVDGSAADPFQERADGSAAGPLHEAVGGSVAAGFPPVAGPFHEAVGGSVCHDCGTESGTGLSFHSAGIRSGTGPPFQAVGSASAYPLFRWGGGASP